MISEIPRTDVGLMSVEEAAAAKGWAVRSVQNWIKGGLLPAVVAGGGMRTVYLLRIRDVDAFIPPPRGRPVEKKPVPPKKPRNKSEKT